MISTSVIVVTYPTWSEDELRKCAVRNSTNLDALIESAAITARAYDAPCYIYVTRSSATSGVAGGQFLTSIDSDPSLVGHRTGKPVSKVAIVEVRS